PASDAPYSGAVKTIDWVDGAVVIVDQTALPHELRLLTLTDGDALADATRGLAVRGAPALGAPGALGVLLAVRQARDEGWDDARLTGGVALAPQARPTAATLAWGGE